LASSRRGGALTCSAKEAEGRASNLSAPSPAARMADKPTDGALQKFLMRSSPFAILANGRARRMGNPLPFMAQQVARADVGWAWRMDWGGHDPATPVAEMHINYHNTGWAIMIFVCTTTFYLLFKR